MLHQIPAEILFFIRTKEKEGPRENALMGLAVTSVTTNLFHTSLLLMVSISFFPALCAAQPWTHFVCLEKGGQEGHSLDIVVNLC